MTRLVVDPTACTGVGLCAHLAPDLVRLDSWGFPVATDEGLAPRERRQAERAAAACPRRALLLTRER